MLEAFGELVDQKSTCVGQVRCVAALDLGVICTDLSYGQHDGERGRSRAAWAAGALAPGDGPYEVEEDKGHDKDPENRLPVAQHVAQVG